MATNNKAEDPKVITFMALRRSIGYLGFFFPFILYLGNVIIGKCSAFEASISEYYYTIMGDVFVGLLVAISLFLISYKGYDKRDNRLTNLAGFFAILVALLPTGNEKVHCPLISLPPSEIRNYAHYTCAAIFFLLLASISYFQFTQTTGGATKAKDNRNKVYKTCGIVILASIILIAIFSFFIPDHVWPTSTFWLEWVALMAFGASWLVKGEVVSALND